MIAERRRYAGGVSTSRTRLALLVSAILLLGGLVLVLALRPGTGSGDSTAYKGSTMPPQVPIEEFSLKDEKGAPVTLASLKGGPSLLTFLFAACTDVCPLTAQQMRGAMDQLGHDVPAVAITVDPKGDTPEAVTRWLADQRMQGRIRWGLGSQSQAEAVWKQYGVAGQSATSDHSSYVFVLDRDGRRCVSWPVSQLTPEGLAHDLKVLEANGGRCRS